MIDVLRHEIAPGQFFTVPMHGAGRQIVVRVGVVLRLTETRVVARLHGNVKNTTVQHPGRMTVVDPVTVPSDVADWLDRVYNDHRSKTS